MKIVFVMLTCSGLWMPATAQKQSRLITGMVVSDAGNHPIEGALVWVKGSKKYSGTHADGVYIIDVDPVDTTLVVSYRDLEPVEVKVTGETEYNVVLRRIHTRSGTASRSGKLNQNTNHR